MSLNELAKEIHENAVAHGWWEDERSFAEIVALCHTELSEALEEERDGHPNAWYKCMKNPTPSAHNCDVCPFDGEGGCLQPEIELKPEGRAVELIDCIIRILDWMGHEQVDVDMLMRRKMDYNKTRPYRHGGKKL